MEKFKGDYLTNCSEKLANITQDQCVSNKVKFGLTMEFGKVPVCQFVFIYFHFYSHLKKVFSKLYLHIAT